MNPAGASSAVDLLDNTFTGPATTDNDSHEADLVHAQHRLAGEIQRWDSLLVAFSGGVDSALLLAAAVRWLGAPRVVAATAVSPALPGHELADARALATEFGVVHLTPTTAELSRPGYVANGRDRCAFCKGELLDVLQPLRQEHGLTAVATGTNLDDALHDFRPGIAAAASRGAATPLRAAGFTKVMVRETARRWGLRVWDKPAAACLSSRVAYGVTISRDRLARIERAESDLRRALTTRGIPVRDLRVRDLGECARIEVDAHLVPMVDAHRELTGEVVDAAGFSSWELDPRGFRSGSMNERG
jgi:pyridinium-3,5-biscarboxylic acid mononucleotide sulfurtransferase